MRAFISQPMKGLSKEEILRNRQEAKLNVCNIDPIMGVGESVKRMAEAGRSIEGALYEG
jgi:hypothetical protein